MARSIMSGILACTRVGYQEITELGIKSRITAIWVLNIDISLAHNYFLSNPHINSFAEKFYCANQSSSGAHSYEFLDARIAHLDLPDVTFPILP